MTMKKTAIVLGGVVLFVLYFVFLFYFQRCS